MSAKGGWLGLRPRPPPFCVKSAGAPEARGRWGLQYQRRTETFFRLCIGELTRSVWTCVLLFPCPFIVSMAKMCCLWILWLALHQRKARNLWSQNTTVDSLWESTECTNNRSILAFVPALGAQTESFKRKRRKGRKAEKNTTKSATQAESRLHSLNCSVLRTQLHWRIQGGS